MFEYFIRRILLTIPTFIGCTLVVFTIVQLAPGGPLEQQIQALKQGGQEGGASATGAENEALPPEALKELKRFYGFDKPIWQRYLIWLGVMQREAKSYRLYPDRPRFVGGERQFVLKNNGKEYQVFDVKNLATPVTDWVFDQETDTTTKETEYRVYQKEYSGILTGNFGKSYRFRKPVLELIKDRLPVSAQFGLISFILSYVICVYLGIQKALRHNSFFDFITSSAVFIAYSVPGWAIGSVLLVLFTTDQFLPLFPLGGVEDPNYASFTFMEKVYDRLIHFFLPLIAFVINNFATLTMLMKNSLLDNLSQDYIRTAFAKGIHERRVIWLHAMRNSIIPIATNIGFVIGVFLAGSYLVERVFDIDGIGKLTFEAVVARDYPIVFCFTVISVVITLAASIISDFVLALTDPRIRFK